MATIDERVDDLSNRKDRKEATLDDIKFFMEKQNHITHNNFIREKLGLGKGEK